MAAKRKAPKKICFIACPIGDVESPERKRANIVQDFIVRPALGKGFSVLRADQDPEPGIITRQIIQHLRDDDLVVADLTENNPNVWYELAIRHAVAKPFIQIVQLGQAIPFDTKHQKTLEYDLHDPYSLEACRKAVQKQVRHIFTAGFQVETPIGQALALEALAAQGGIERVLADLVEQLKTRPPAIRWHSRFDPASAATANTSRSVQSNYTLSLERRLDERIVAWCEELVALKGHPSMADLVNHCIRMAQAEGFPPHVTPARVKTIVVNYFFVDGDKVVVSKQGPTTNPTPSSPEP